MQLTDSQATKIKALMLARTQPAYFSMDRKMRLVEWSLNIADYGYEGMEIDADCADIFEFLVGYEPKEAMDLPIVTSPNKTHCSISILLEEEMVYVLLMDASKDFDQQFLLQQKANEASLLNAKQRKLMGQLIGTQRELEKKNIELEEAYSLQRRFLSGVSHEFRTPLTSIIGYANALIEQSRQIDKGLSQSDWEKAQISCRDKLRIVANNSNYLLSLVENLLDHGKTSEQEIIIHPQLVEIGDFFSSLHEMLFPIAERQNVDFLLTLGTVGEFHIDETKVRQCVINLVNNAIKFTEEGSVELSVFHQDDELVIQVEDTGIGMTKEELSRIFESFWQSNNHRQAGAGLGMTITKRILEGMAGDISIDSKLGVGTKVTISFPAYTNPEASTEDAVPDSQVTTGKSKQVLLVEDDPDISELIQFYVTNWGHKAQICHDGQQALDWLAENTADVIFLDLNMPVLDGSKTLAAAREKGIETPIYIMSAQPLGNDEVLDERLQRHADGHILKPVDFRELELLLAQIN